MTTIAATTASSLNDIHGEALDLKDEGNRAFKSGDMTLANHLYTKAINVLRGSDADLAATILSNRAATFLKSNEYAKCIDDCDKALQLAPGNVKAIYRRSQAKLGTADLSGAFDDLMRVIKVDPKNAEALASLRSVKETLEKERASMTEVRRIMKSIRAEENVTDCMKALISRFADDKFHAMDFVRSGGIEWVGAFLEQTLSRISSPESQPGDQKGQHNELLSLTVRLLAEAASHSQFVRVSVDIAPEDPTSSSTQTILGPAPENASAAFVNHLGKLKFESLCSLLLHKEKDVFLAALSLVMRILKALPLHYETTRGGSESADATAVAEPKKFSLFLKEVHVKSLFGFLVAPLLDDCTATSSKRARAALFEGAAAGGGHGGGGGGDDYDCNWDWICTKIDTETMSGHERLSVALDSVASLCSDSPDYHQSEAAEPIVDMRNESNEARRVRQDRRRLLKHRASQHATWAIEVGLVDALVMYLDDENALVRQQVAVCLGQLAIAVDNDNQVKCVVAHYLGKEIVEVEGKPQSSAGAGGYKKGESRVEELSGDDDKETVGVVTNADKEQSSAAVKTVTRDSETDTKALLLPPAELPSLAECRAHTALTIALLTARPELGTWALERPGGVQQLILLIASGEPRCQELAAEALCLAASTDSGSSLLSSVISSGAMQPLLQSHVQSIRTAAASTIAKLSIKAKALKEDSEEVSMILNTALTVLKNSGKASNGTDRSQSTTSTPANKKEQKTKVATAASTSTSVKSLADLRRAESIVSTERAVEMLASMVGRTHIKEEIVHGSFRVAPALSSLIDVDVDTRSTAAYGIAHILSCLTVTNYELKAKALAEKEITVEQYEKLQDLQRIKPQDEEGKLFEEKLEGPDPDTLDMCRIRIKRVAASNGIKLLVKFVSEGSTQTKEAAARTVRQMCVEESVRGMMVQQGALKALIDAAADQSNQPGTRRDAAHAVAKILVTTNPHVLSEHLRVTSISPLLQLCKDVDATNLQQFESLLALTNIVSCGQTEQDKLAAEKGVNAVHYLMCCDHQMVRRAAVETFCNMPTHPAVLKLLRSEQVRLWVALLEQGLHPPEESEDGEAEDGDDGKNPNDPNDPEVQAYLTCRAALGTLAVATVDEGVCRALISLSHKANSASSEGDDSAAAVISSNQEDPSVDEEYFPKLLVMLTRSLEKPELVHRTLVIILNLLTATSDGDCEDGSIQSSSVTIVKDIDSVPSVAATRLCKAGIIPVLGVILSQSNSDSGPISQLAAQVAQELQKLVEDC